MFWVRRFVYMYLILLSGLDVNILFVLSCSDYENCTECSARSGWISTCRWCELDKQCHEYGSWLNSCRGDENIVDPEKCPKTVKEKYDPKMGFIFTLLSAAAYSRDPQVCVRKLLKHHGYQVIQLIAHNCADLPLFEYKSCFVYTAVSKQAKQIVVAFRGTAANRQLVNELLSVLMHSKVGFQVGGHVQAYFANVFDKLNPCVEESVRLLQEQYPTFEVVVTGHSLGAAIASLTAASLVYNGIVPADKMTIYSFGSPRVGDKSYAYNHDMLVKRSWRVVHHLDIVSHLPACTIPKGCILEDDEGPYHHGNEVYYPDKDMNVSSSYLQCHGDEDSSCSDGYISGHCIPFLNMDECIDSHVNYFDVHVGKICSQSKAKDFFIAENEFEYYNGDGASEACKIIDVSGKK